MGGDGSSPRSERRRVSVAKQVPVLAPGSLVTKPQSLHTSHVLVEKDGAVTIAVAVHETPSWPPALNRKLNDIRVPTYTSTGHRPMIAESG